MNDLKLNGNSSNKALIPAYRSSPVLVSYLECLDLI